MAGKLTWNGTEEQRFWRRVQIAENGCWEWLPSYLVNGYGIFNLSRESKPEGNAKIRAHIWAYKRYVGPIPEGLELDHTCRNRKCVNPFHLEPVTHRENCLRGESPSARAAKQTHCVNGHEFSADNTYHYRGYRQCKTCKSRRMREFHQRRNANQQQEQYV